jgi:hypothetical protein
MKNKINLYNWLNQNRLKNKKYKILFLITKFKKHKKNQVQKSINLLRNNKLKIIEISTIKNSKKRKLKNNQINNQNRTLKNYIVKDYQ